MKLSCVFLLIAACSTVEAAEWKNEEFCGVIPPGAESNFVTADKGATIQSLLHKRAKRQARPIVNGHDSKESAWPWAVQIQMKFFNKTSKKNDVFPHCTGSLINKKYVLTAAHCVNAGYSNSTPNYESIKRKFRYNFYFGRLNYQDKSKGVRCTLSPRKGIKRHPTFDLALFKLPRHCREAIAKFYGDSIRPICLPSSTLDFRHQNIGRDLVAIGWGATDNDDADHTKGLGLYPTNLQETVLDIQDVDDCYSLFDSGRPKRATPEERKLLGTKATNELMCAARASTDTCGGDSGGPLLAFMEYRWELVGATSIGAGQCASVLGAFYVHIPSAIDWLVKEAQN